MTVSSIPLRDMGLLTRAMRSSAWTIFGFGASQVVRFGSNLILTRLLFPEAFGMMALVTVAMVALGNFSDLGIAPAISQNRRGDDQDFLDTAWTLQAIRGVLLFLGISALAWPISRFYGEPMLAQLLPVAGISMLIGGVMPTSVETAGRHLLLGRVTLIDLASSVIGTSTMLVLALATRSIWSLVIGSVVATGARYVLVRAFLPGKPNRFHWEPEARHELLHFGKWIFVSTICGFLIGQGDRVVLGKYLSLDLLGVYNIGYFLASFPLMLGAAVVGRILIPLYRDRQPAASSDRFGKFRLMRMALTGGMIVMLLAMAMLGVQLVDFLYDSRFSAAGPIIVLIACMQVPQAIGMTYDQAALAAGDSRRFFLLIAPRAVLLIAFILIGIHLGGLVGAIVGQGLASLMVYPLVVRLARRFAVWDPLHDALFAIIGLVGGGLALWLHREAILHLVALG